MDLSELFQTTLIPSMKKEEAKKPAKKAAQKKARSPLNTGFR